MKWFRVLTSGGFDTSAHHTSEEAMNAWRTMCAQHGLSESEQGQEWNRTSARVVELNCSRATAMQALINDYPDSRYHSG